MSVIRKFIVIELILGLVGTTAYALPIDWEGDFSVESVMIKNARRSTDSCTPAAGSMCVTDDSQNVRFQFYEFNLKPTIIVNDSASIKAEFSNSTEYFGEGSLWNEGQNGAYFSQEHDGGPLNVTELYAVLYADTAVYRIGKFSRSFGLGATINDSGYDGFEGTFKFGNFKMVPMWSRVATPTNKPHTGKYDVTETSLEMLYENPKTNLNLGLYYAVRESETHNELYGASNSHSVTLTDIFIEKRLSDFRFAFEIPMISGDVGTLYDSQVNDRSFSANAYIAEISYQANPRWSFGLNAGVVNGDDGSTDTFEGMYLHPAYQVADLMFHYNAEGFNTAGQDPFHSGVTNATYFKFFANYSSDVWTWKMSYIMAKADEVASTGEGFYNHQTMTFATAAADQSDDLGSEFDVSFDYLWNPSITVTGFLGYHMVGDYYAFLNDASNELSVETSYTTGFKIGISF